MSDLTVKTDGMGDGHFIMGKYDPNASGAQILLAITAVALLSGTVLGKILTGAATLTAAAAVSGSGGTPGNGVVGSMTADTGAPLGVYQVRFLDPGTDLGDFEVIRPDGSVDGNGVVGTAYNGLINFTIADGSTDFVEDDRIAITLTRAAGTSYKPLDPAAVDGSQNFAAILFGGRPISASTQYAAGVIGPGPVIVNYNLLTFVNALNAAQKATFIAQARALGIVVAE